jgi:hypothetical protein
MAGPRPPTGPRRPRIRGMTRPRQLGGPRRRIRGMTRPRWLGGPRRRIRGMTRPRWLGGLRRRIRGMTRSRSPGGPRRRMIRGTGGPRQRTIGMTRGEYQGGLRRRTLDTSHRRQRIWGMTSPRWLGGLRRIQGLVGRPRMIQGTDSLRWLVGLRPQARSSACPRLSIPVSAAPPLPGRAPVAVAVRVQVTSGPRRAAATAAGIVVPETRALLAAKRQGLRLVRLARDRRPLARPAATRLRRGKHRARKLGRPQNASLPARLSDRAPERPAVGYRCGYSRWPVPRPSWRELPSLY